jgi:hypothetical protein
VKRQIQWITGKIIRITGKQVLVEMKIRGKFGNKTKSITK